MGRVLDRDELLAERRRWKERSQKTVLTNGCYDLLHPGHIRLLERARSLGDRLIVAINSDSSVRGLKGPLRPIIGQDERAELLASLEAVDAVTIFDEETPCELLSLLLPDVLVKGADWSHWIAGREIVEAAGGQVLALPLEPDFSTTGIVETVLEQQR
ncbi:MAG TPA: adenylyltransferase/cytidyltransferase family protein [Bryobacterales bacterium]|nr:adenylyltransferase/cytidyltransferase family protein [Bryobacterales bacterium]